MLRRRYGRPMTPRDVMRQLVPAPIRSFAWKATWALEREQQAIFEGWLGVSYRGRASVYGDCRCNPNDFAGCEKHRPTLADEEARD